MDTDAIQAAHRRFSAEAFNSCWDLIRLETRTREQDREMIRRAEASFWHWQARMDRKPVNDAIGYWQLARVYALAGEATTAIDYANAGLEVARSKSLEPFFIGYAWESLARAQSAARLFEECAKSLANARAASEGVADEKDRADLLADLETVRAV